MKKKSVFVLVVMLLAMLCVISFADEWHGSDEEGWWYSFSKGGYAKNQWLKINKEKYYFDASGYMATGWKQINGNWYFFSNSGKYATGWFKDEGKWYYADKNGVMQTGWIKLNNNWYLFKSSGEMVTGWYKDGTWYYFKQTGEMATGWFEDEGKWYFADENGAYQTGWLEDGNTWYYLKSDGSMAVGFTDINGTTYYFDQNGIMKTGWVEIDGNLYYFYSSGNMAKNAVIEGKYYCDSNGIWIQNPISTDKTEITIGVGETANITVTYLQDNAYIKNTIKNGKIVSIAQGEKNSQTSRNYTITGLSVGTTAITFYYENQHPAYGTNIVASVDVTITVRLYEVNTLFGLTVAEANERVPDKFIYIGDGYYSNGSVGFTLDANGKINWIALLSDDVKYILFGVRPGMNWIQSQATLFGTGGYRPINNSPNDSIFLNSNYPDRMVTFKKDSQGKVANVVYGLR